MRAKSGHGCRRIENCDSFHWREAPAFGAATASGGGGTTTMGPFAACIRTISRARPGYIHGVVVEQD